MTHLKLFLSSFAFSAVLLGCGEVSPPMQSGSDPTSPDAATEAPARFDLAANLTKVPILQGTAIEVAVTVTRLDAAVGPIEIVVDSLPAGVTASAPDTLTSC